MSTVPSVVRSRWGFHPCEFSTYRKLKLLNLVYQRAVRMAHAWQRWKRKDPHNRVSRRRIRNDDGRTIGYGPPTPIAEPPLCTVFSRKAKEKRFVDNGRVICSAGIAAGIDMSLHVVGRLLGKEVAEMAARQMEYPFEATP